jgi:hypothetical protein
MERPSGSIFHKAEASRSQKIHRSQHASFLSLKRTSLFLYLSHQQPQWKSQMTTMMEKYITVFSLCPEGDPPGYFQTSLAGEGERRIFTHRVEAIC